MNQPYTTGFVVQEQSSRCFVRLRSFFDPCGVYVRSAWKATIFETEFKARRYCGDGRCVVRPASQAFAIPATLDYVRVPPQPEVTQ